MYEANALPLTPQQTANKLVYNNKIFHFSLQEFDWDESVKSYLLSSFFWGYVVTQVPAGYLSARYGAKYTFFYGILICSVLAVLTPLCAHIGNWPLVLALRATQGLSQGMIFPSTHTFLSKWAPAEERGRLVSYCYSGAQFGTVIIMSASGYIASSRYGWPCIFYLSGAAGLMWAFVWLYCCASTPAEHPYITVAERRYIESSAQARRPSDAGRDDERPPTPWLKIFTSPPFLILLLVHCANNWGFWTLLTEIPTYMKNILGMDIKSNGPLSALPYLVMGLLSFGFIFVADFLNRRSVMPLAFSRKLFNSLGQWVPMVALLGLGYISAGGDSYKLAIALLTVAVGANAATYLGFQVNHIDLSPQFAGTLMGITNCAANVISIIAPLSVGLIVTDEVSAISKYHKSNCKLNYCLHIYLQTNPIQWRYVFFLSAAFYFFGNFLFVFFGRTSVQPWNFPAQTGRTAATATAVARPASAASNHGDASEPLIPSSSA